jgi:hypothetical protein
MCHIITVYKTALTLVLFIFTCHILQAQPCTGSSTNIGGVVFKDFNASGIKDAAETLQSGVEIKVYDCTGTLVGSDISDANGNWFVTVPIAPSATVKYRVEFTIPTALASTGLQSSLNGTGSKTDVQFVAAASCTTNFGVTYPSDYCQVNPDLSISCFVGGNPLPGGSTAAPLAAIVTVPYGVAAGTAAAPAPTAPVEVADALAVGSVWASAYQTTSKKLFSAAFLKRHVGLGSQGLGGIYQTNLSGAPATTPYFDLESFGYDLGQSVIATRALPPSASTVSPDPTAFDAVGKIGLGGITLSDDGAKMYITDLYNRQIFIVNIGNPAKATITAADITTVPIPNPSCNKGVARPFALKYYHGKLYAGIVCTGENAGAIADVVSYVYTFDPISNTFDPAPIFSMPMTYTKGAVHTLNNWETDWNPWVSTFAQLTTNGVTGVGTTRTGLPQPMLSSIDFTDDGDLLLGFMDRAGHQLGYRQVNTAGAGDYSGYIGGDILRANFNGTAWILESNGTVGTRTSAGGVGNNQGPGGATAATRGEFYYEDNFILAGVDTHQETFQGAMLNVPGKNEIVVISMDPLNVFSGGLTWFSNTNGSDTKRYQVYQSTGANSPNYGKANGLGAIQALCAAPPLEIGNRVWIDTDKDGIQDACEAPLAGVQVSLYKTDGTLVATKTTDATGNYYFKDYQQYGTGYDTLTINTM